MKSFVLLVVVFLWNCDAAGVTYSYDPTSDIGPSKWTDVSATCGGSRQSPIDIISASALPDGLSSFTSTSSATPQTASVDNSEHGVTVSLPASAQGSNKLTGSTLLGNEYNLLQYHFHAPSEHTVDGASFPLEVHYVHQAGSGHYAVVGVLFQVTNNSNPNLDALIAGLANAPNVGDSTTINTPYLYPQTGSYWSYRGSLTTPPCTEAVDWFLFQEPITISSAQLTTIVNSLDPFPSNRPTQPQNGRQVYNKQAGYSYDPNHVAGPANWKNFWPDCGGTLQSPIDVVSSSVPIYGSISSTQTTNAASFELENLEHTLEVNVGSAGGVVNTPTTSGHKLLQYHMHSPSEHTINGQFYDLEIHYVHKHPSHDQYTVMGYFFDIGAENAQLKPITDAIETVSSAGAHASINVQASYSTSGNFFTYKGGFTTPPCSELVDFYLSTTPGTISQAQYDAIRTVLSSSFSTNNRPLQDLNGRVIKRVTDVPSVTPVAPVSPCPGSFTAVSMWMMFVAFVAFF